MFDFVHNFQVFFRPNIVKNNVWKDAQCSVTVFCVHGFFVYTTFSLWDIVDFVFDIHSELVWNSRDFCESNSDANRNFCEPDSDANQWGYG